MNNFFKRILNDIKTWFTTKMLPWLKKAWMQIVNMIVLFAAYSSLNDDSFAGVIVGFWIFILLSYYIFIKLFKFELNFISDKKEDIKIEVPVITAPVINAPTIATPVKENIKLDNVVIDADTKKTRKPRKPKSDK